MSRPTQTKSTVSVKYFVAEQVEKTVALYRVQFILNVDTAQFAWEIQKLAYDLGHNINHQSAERRLRAESAKYRKAA